MKIYPLEFCIGEMSWKKGKKTRPLDTSYMQLVATPSLALAKSTCTHIWTENLDQIENEVNPKENQNDLTKVGIALTLYC